MPWLSKITSTVDHEYRRATGRLEAGDEEWESAFDAPEGNAVGRAPGGFTPLSPDGQQDRVVIKRRR
jgi:hypothetical protein